ncbi:MAG: helix-turn-helix domain-containing protein [Deltaproteobacteria bacterium]|nr:helix-turn-helix domain-containing protein [Deltaproteobacteria bacterium]
MGRPTKYRREYPKLAAVLLAQGYSEAKVAEVLRVGPSTLSDWKRSYPEFAKALDVDNR